MPEPPHQPGYGPVGADAGRRPRYRSLRDLNHTSRPAPPAQLPAGEPPQPPAGTRPPHHGPPGWHGEPSARSGALRQAALGALAMLLLVGLVWGGYQGYRYFAPYYGLGYETGATGSVQDVQFTVTAARCGLQQVPDDDAAKPVKGQFCLIDLQAFNDSDRVRYLSLTMFSVQLDSGTRASPLATAMKNLSVKLEVGEKRELRLVYDVWDGIRMNDIKVQIGYESTTIPLR